jgi:hypothetical protein
VLLLMSRSTFLFLTGDKVQNKRGTRPSQFTLPPLLFLTGTFSLQPKGTLWTFLTDNPPLLFLTGTSSQKTKGMIVALSDDTFNPFVLD